jgi:hypothetical protein
MVYESGKKPIAIRGLVVPVEWDENGGVSGIAVYTFDEQEYLVSSQEKGAELLAFVRMEVKVKGILSMVKDKQTVIVQEYMVGRQSG